MNQDKVINLFGGTISFISIALTTDCKNYWHVNPMTTDDLHNFQLGRPGHNMKVGDTLGPWL